MTVSGILFSRPMVLALEAGIKTQTRRIVKPQPTESVTSACTYRGGPSHGEWSWLSGDPRDCDTWGFEGDFLCPYGNPGDLVYCKETVIPAARNDGRVLYAANCEDIQLTAIGVARGGWKPSIMMRQDEARFWYRLAALRVERLQDITEEDAKAEGIEPAVDGSYVSAYAALWNQINSGFKPVKTRDPFTGWAVTHYVSHPWGGENATVTHKGLPAYVRPNPFVFALTLAPTAAPGTTATPTAQEA